MTRLGICLLPSASFALSIMLCLCRCLLPSIPLALPPSLPFCHSPPLALIFLFSRLSVCLASSLCLSASFSSCSVQCCLFLSVHLLLYLLLFLPTPLLLCLPIALPNSPSFSSSLALARQLSPRVLLYSTGRFLLFSSCSVSISSPLSGPCSRASCWPR